jgi:hypothetical protein
MHSIWYNPGQRHLLKQTHSLIALKWLDLVAQSARTPAAMVYPETLHQCFDWSDNMVQMISGTDNMHYRTD